MLNCINFNDGVFADYAICQYGYDRNKICSCLLERIGYILYIYIRDKIY